jgi:hypothetical protein
MWMSGHGRVVHNPNAWSDAGVYTFSTLAINGAPDTNTIYQIRGTSLTNIWAVGASDALHKTTP